MKGGHYIITTHRGRDGVGLSKAGHFGGLRFCDDKAAERFAREDAGDGAIRIERDSVARLGKSALRG